MTMFTTFTGMNSMRDICLFSDFITSTAPFNVATDGTLGTTTVSNTNNNNVVGQASISTPNTTSGAIFAYSGIYMAPAQSAPAAALTRDFRLGNGEVDIYGSGIVGPNVGVAALQCSFGVSTGNYSVALIPATDFAGFFVNGSKTNWSYGVVINSVLTSFDTTLSKTAPQSFQVIISKNASKTSFIANGKNIGSINAQLRTSAAVLPAFEVKDCTAGGTAGGPNTATIDQMTVRLRIER
jgi:hypothetical protein